MDTSEKKYKKSMKTFIKIYVYVKLDPPSLPNNQTSNCGTSDPQGFCLLKVNVKTHHSDEVNKFVSVYFVVNKYSVYFMIIFINVFKFYNI